MIMTTFHKQKDYIIHDIKAREILDSRGNPTVEVDVYTKNSIGRASVPSGTSTGSYEAIEIRDKDPYRYHCMGVLKSIDIIISKIKPHIIGEDIREQRKIDELMIKLDGTSNKQNLGANSILAVSMAVSKAASLELNLPLYRYLGGINTYTLPIPTFNIINGGKHAGNNLTFQEFMIQPIGASSFNEALKIGSEIYHTLGNYLKEKYGSFSTNIGYEGGYAPKIDKTIDALDSLLISIEKSGYSESEVKIGIDVAASEFYDKYKKCYYVDNNILCADELHDYYKLLIKNYPIYSIEDPFHEDSFIDFQKLTKESNNTIIVGDDLFATNPNRIKHGIKCCSTKGLLMKINQIGSISEAFDAASLALKNGLSLFVSHRSADTEDTTISDIAVALNANFIKTGAPARGERIAKYNQLLRIEEELNSVSTYAKLD